IPLGALSLSRLLRATIQRLVAGEGLWPNQIVVLTPHSQAHSELAEGDAHAGLELTWSTSPGPDQVRVSSIHAFKGLESDVVILVETDHLAANRAGPRLVYVALSRAKHHLIVLGHLPSPASNGK